MRKMIYRLNWKEKWWGKRNNHSWLGGLGKNPGRQWHLNCILTSGVGFRQVTDEKEQSRQMAHHAPQTQRSDIVI